MRSTGNIRTLVLAAGALALVTGPSASAGGFNMRDCRLDRLVFVDPWTGQQFSVEYVGTAYYYLCGQDWEQRRENIGGECLGPFGNLVLQGTRTEQDGNDPAEMSAIYHTIKGAPCCGWRGQPWNKAQASAQVRDLKWLEGEKVPTLGDTRFGSIDGGPYGDDTGFQNPMIALVCRG